VEIDFTPADKTYLNEFEYDIYISYAHIDNISILHGEAGWVANFQRALEVRLAQLMGEKVKIWRDKKLQGNDIFSYEIVERIHKTALMISILSPGYIKSEWCIKEIREFIEAAPAGIGTKIGSKSRIFKVIKTGVPYEILPMEIADTLGYEFFVTDPNTGRMKELNQESQDELGHFYWSRIDDIAHDIKNLLEEIKQPDVTSIPQQKDQLKVYLAETSPDLIEQRDIIRRELNEYGYETLPDRRLSSVKSEFKKEVENFLDQCVLSIHLVGGGYGPVPEGFRESIVELQNELAVKKSKTGALQRLIWMPPDCDMSDERQTHFINRVQTDVDTQYGADIFKTSIVDFKNALRDKLKNIEDKKRLKKEEEKTSIVKPVKKGPLKIYLICDRRDLDSITELENFLYRSGFEVILPAFEGEEEELIQDHLENLKNCDAAIIYYGLGNELWMRSKTRDLTKIAGYGRTRPLHLRAIFLAPPASRHKERFRSHEWNVINGTKGFFPGLIEPYIEIMKSVGK